MNDDQGRQLIQEAAGSYLRALYAIREFRREVQERCTQVVKPRLLELAKCTGVPMVEEMLGPWAYPDKLANWDGQSATVGVKLEARRGSLVFYYVLGWELPEGQSPSTYVLADVEVVGSRQAVALLDGLKKIGHPHLDRNGNEVNIWRPVDVGHIGDFDQSLDQVIDEWCQLWRDAGGLDKLVPLSSVQASPPA
jgi:hypothetical protein